MLTTFLLLTNLVTAAVLLFTLYRYKLLGKLLDRFFPFLGVRSAGNPIPEANPFFVDRTDLFDGYPAVTGAFVLLGDSHVHRANWDELLAFATTNRGISSDTTTGILQRLPKITAMRPSSCLVMIGTNDVLHGEPVRAIVNRLTKIVTTLTDAKIETTLHSVLYMSNKKSGFQTLNKKITQLNLALEELAQLHQLTLVDLNARLSEGSMLSNQFTRDGVHLTASGYKIWAEEIKCIKLAQGGESAIS